MADTLTDSLVGQVVDGRYLVRELVATGGMGTVYLAQDRRLGRDIALKVMSPSMVAAAGGADFTAHFRREARAAARLTHPGAVRVYDQGSDGDLNYLTMEYVDGVTLRARLSQQGTLPVGQSLDILERVLDALGAAHRQGLVHRDVKPENILIDSEGEPKIGDFGLARAVTEITSATTGTVLGSVSYLAPELLSTGRGDARADVYAAGVLLFEMLTGRRPLHASSALEVAARHAKEDVPHPSEHIPWLPPELDALVSAFTARDPARRPVDAGAALALLRQTRSMIDDPTLARRGDPPSGSIPLAGPADDTQVLSPVDPGRTAHPATGSTVALPIGLGGEASTEPLDGMDLVPVGTGEIPAPGRRTKLAWWIGAAVAVAAIFSGLGVWWYGTYGPGAYTSVPSVTGMSPAEAEDFLEAQGFLVDSAETFHDTVPAGDLVGTSPAENEQIAKGGAITLQVSRGPLMYDVPPVVGVLEEDALAMLEEAGFSEPSITRDYSDDVPEGEVISSTPEPGETVRHDTKVALTISQGPEPITMPNVVGKTEGQAKADLERYALDVTVRRERTIEAPKGEVFKQDPEASSPGFRTQEVTIWVSDGPPLVEVEDYVFMAVDVARDRAEDLGLVVELRKKWPWSDPNTIRDQSIPPGTEVEVGTKIVLIYD